LNEWTKRDLKFFTNYASPYMFGSKNKWVKNSNITQYSIIFNVPVILRQISWWVLFQNVHIKLVIKYI